MSAINQTEELLEMLKEDKELNLIEIEDLKNQKNILHFKLLTMKIIKFFLFLLILGHLLILTFYKTITQTFIHEKKSHFGNTFF